MILALGHFVFDGLGLQADSVRDGYPYLMVALVLLAPRLPAGRVAEWMYRVLNFHLIWVGIALIVPSIPEFAPVATRFGDTHP